MRRRGPFAHSPRVAKAVLKKTQRLLGAVTDEHPASIAMVNRVVVLSLSLADGLPHHCVEVASGVATSSWWLARPSSRRPIATAPARRLVVYAAPTIMGELKRYVRTAAGWSDRLVASGAVSAAGPAEARPEQRLHRPAFVAELPFALGVTERQVRTARQAGHLQSARPARRDDAWWLAWGLEELGTGSGSSCSCGSATP